MKKYIVALTCLVASLSAIDERETSTFQLESIAYETPYRILTNKDPSGFSVELDDGSMWRITDNSSAYQVQTWRANDSLVIRPTLFPTLSGARFYLYNERLRSEAYAELSYGPLLNKATCVKITYMDYVNGMIEMRDGAGNTCYWEINPTDRNVSRSWKCGQTLML